MSAIYRTLTIHIQQGSRSISKHIGDIIPEHIETTGNTVVQYREVQSDILHCRLLPGHVGIAAAQQGIRHVGDTSVRKFDIFT